MPMQRALPAMVRTAASRSAAGQVRHLELGDFFGLRARELADLVGVRLAASPFRASAAFLIRTVAGGVFITKVKLLSAKAVITTGIGRPGSIPLRLGVERLAEFHDVQAALAQRRADRRATDWPCRPALAA